MPSVGTWLRIGAFAAALAVFAGSAQAQPPTTPQDPQSGAVVIPDVGESSGQPQQPRRPPVKDPKLQPTPVNANPTREVQVLPKTQPSTTHAWLLDEITTAFLIVMISVIGVVGMAVATRYYFRITTSSNPYHLALSDPWVRAHAADRAADPPVDKPAAEPAEPDAASAGES
jgi:hypothetical protein